MNESFLDSKELYTNIQMHLKVFKIDFLY